MGCVATRMRWKRNATSGYTSPPPTAEPLLKEKPVVSKINFFYNFYKLSSSFYKKQKRFYKLFNSFYKTSNIVYNVWNFTTQPIMHIKMLLQFNFSLRFQRKVRSTENRVIGVIREVEFRFLCKGR